MTVNEQLVENIVKEVMAKVALTSDDEKQLGIFTDMNEAIAAAKQAQAVVRRHVHGPERENHLQYPYQDQRKRRGYGQDGRGRDRYGQCGPKILKHVLVA